MNTTNGNKNTTIIVRLTKRERESIELLTQRKGFSTLSETVRMILHEGLERHLPVEIGMSPIIKRAILDEKRFA